MEPIFVTFILFVLLPIVVFRGIKSIKDSKYRAMYEGGVASGGESSGAALKQSELRAMINDAVIEATIPLVDRIEELERELLIGDGRIDASAMAEAFDGEGEMESDEDESRERQRLA